MQPWQLARDTYNSNATFLKRESIYIDTFVELYLHNTYKGSQVQGVLLAASKVYVCLQNSDSVDSVAPGEAVEKIRI